LPKIGLGSVLVVAGKIRYVVEVADPEALMRHSPGTG
jgi:hypothetical protein